jgi:hypothetical protein
MSLGCDSGFTLGASQSNVKLQKSGRFRLEISVHFVPLSHINIVIFDHRSTFNNLLDKESMAIQKIKVHTVFSRGLAVAYL